MFAAAPWNNTSSANVVNPVMFKFLPVISSYTMSPVTFKLPPTDKLLPTVTIPAKAALPLCCIVERPTVIPIPVVSNLFALSW